MDLNYSTKCIRIDVNDMFSKAMESAIASCARVSRPILPSVYGEPRMIFGEDCVFTLPASTPLRDHDQITVVSPMVRFEFTHDATPQGSPAGRAPWHR